MTSTGAPVVLVMDDGYGVVDEVYGPFDAYDQAEEWAFTQHPSRFYRIRRLRPPTPNAPSSESPDG